MFIELTQLGYDPNTNEWIDGKITITSKAVVAFYPQTADLDGPSFVVLAGFNDPILVQEPYYVLTDRLNPPVQEDNVGSDEEDKDSVKPFVWISCDEHLPDKDGSYLVTTNRKSYSVDIGIFKDGKWRVPGSKVLAWMDVPRPVWYQTY